MAISAEMTKLLKRCQALTVCRRLLNDEYRSFWPEVEARFGLLPTAEQVASVMPDEYMFVVNILKRERAKLILQMRTLEAEGGD